MNVWRRNEMDFDFFEKKKLDAEKEEFILLEVKKVFEYDAEKKAYTNILKAIQYTVFCLKTLEKYEVKVNCSILAISEEEFAQKKENGEKVIVKFPEGIKVIPYKMEKNGVYVSMLANFIEICEDEKDEIYIIE